MDEATRRALAVPPEMLGQVSALEVVPDGEQPNRRLAADLGAAHQAAKAAGRAKTDGFSIGDDELWRIPMENGMRVEGAEAELVQQNRGWSNSMDPSNDGYIYAPTNLHDELRRIDPDANNDYVHPPDRLNFCSWTRSESPNTFLGILLYITFKL